MGISLRRFDGRDKMAFNEAQKRAIRHFKGPAMVLAGPGSGKTTVITHRVKALIEERGVDPGSILVITFTKAAAAEMKERFGALTENRYGRVGFGTFHAVFFQILKPVSYTHLDVYKRQNIYQTILQQNVENKITKLETYLRS